VSFQGGSENRIPVLISKIYQGQAGINNICGNFFLLLSSFKDTVQPFKVFLRCISALLIEKTN
jgi:hypothetical protein